MMEGNADLLGGYLWAGIVQARTGNVRRDFVTHFPSPMANQTLARVRYILQG